MKIHEMRTTMMKRIEIDGKLSGTVSTNMDGYM